MRFQWIIPVTICVNCLRKNPKDLYANTFKPLMWEPEQSAKVNTDINPCDHKDTSIVVLEIVATCEKTAIQCDYCGEILTEPKTDCR